MFVGRMGNGWGMGRRKKIAGMPEEREKLKALGRRLEYAGSDLSFQCSMSIPQEVAIGTGTLLMLVLYV